MARRTVVKKDMVSFKDIFKKKDNSTVQISSVPKPLTGVTEKSAPNIYPYPRWVVWVFFLLLTLSTLVNIASIILR